jgi:hypothetical protein
LRTGAARFAVLQAIRNHSQCERLGGSQGLFARPPVNRNSRKSRDVSDPTPVVFSREFDFEIKRLGAGSVFHRFT